MASKPPKTSGALPAGKPSALFEPDDQLSDLEKLLARGGWTRMATRARNSRVLSRAHPSGEGREYGCADCVTPEAGGPFVVGDLDYIRAHRAAEHHRVRGAEATPPMVEPQSVESVLQLKVGDLLKAAEWEQQAAKWEAEAEFWKAKYETTHRRLMALVRAMDRLPWLDVKIVEED